MIPERRIALEFPPRPHEAVLGEGLLARLGAFVADTVAPGACALVTDAGVAATPHAAAAEASLRAAGFVPTVVVLPQGEAAKSLAEAADLWSAFAAAGIDRKRVVVAVGGGAVGDVAGFAAATWMRGVPIVQVPTTVLAMADAAIGGKTAVNLAEGKNLVGVVHQPELVVADVATLATLPARELRSGFAEIVKCAVLADRAALARLRDDAPRCIAGDAAALADWIAFAIAVKAEHVRGDPLDVAGVRALLNLGHTTAHALEAASGYGTMLHGEAVAVGLVVAARIAAARGLCDASLIDDVSSTLAAFELPTVVPPQFSPAALVAHARVDKKRAAGRARMILPRATTGASVVEVDDAEFAAALG